MTSEVEVKVKVEVNIEVRSIHGLYRSTSILNFRLVASKMTELWIFKNLSSEVEVEAEVKIEVRYI